MIDIGEELPDIAFEYPCGSRAIARDFAREMSESVHGSVRPLILATGIGIVDEETIKEGIQHSVNCVVNQAITNMCLVNMAWFWIIDSKRLVRPMTIRLVFKFSVELYDMIHKIEREFLDILPVSFSA